MTSRNRLLLYLSLACLLQGMLLLSCKQPAVTVGGTPVTEAAFVTATMIVHDIEVGNVAIGDFLIQRHQRACTPLTVAARLTDTACVQATAWLHESATTYTPKVLLAITEVRDVLKIVATNPAGTTQEKITEATTRARDVFQAMSAWAQQLGWVPSQTGKVTP